MSFSLRKSLNFQYINDLIVDLVAPINLSYVWNWGSLLGFFLIIQIITGIFLAMFYCPNEALSFRFVAELGLNINNGFFFRFLHGNGASVFFLCVYFHIAKGIYFGGFNNIKVWSSGIIIYILMVATAFLGYVLPWGQMSFWAGAVITNLFSVIPYVGELVVHWIWGGFSVSNSTLNSFYSLHYLLPFLLVGLIVVHLFFLHQSGSNNTLGVGSYSNNISFYPYYIFKDLSGNLIILCGLCVLIASFPYLLGDPENFKCADPLVSPIHIKPEWYFLFIYAILRSIPNKIGGVVLLVGSLLVWFILPFIHVSRLRGFFWKPLGRVFFWFFIFDFFLLTYIGCRPVEEPYIGLGQMAAIFYFFFFLILLPICSDWTSIEKVNIYFKKIKENRMVFFYNTAFWGIIRWFKESNLIVFFKFLLNKISQVILWIWTKINK